MDLRATARQIFLEAINQVHLGSILEQTFRSSAGTLQIQGTSYDLSHFKQIFFIGLGKAAVPVTEALLRALQPLLTPAHTVRGRIIGSTRPSHPDPRLAYPRGAHPLPDQTSMQAAEDILNLLAGTTPDTLVFFLISGGASAMADLPLDPSISLADLIDFHRTLVHSGLSIAEMNTLRKHVSAIKGGRLAVAAYPASQCTLLVSDVPPSRPDMIASGPTLPDPTTLDDCRRLLDTALAQASIPSSIRRLLKDRRTPETPKSDHPTFARATVHTLLSSDDLAESAREAATAGGLHTAIDLTPDDWPFEKAATYLLDQLDQLAAMHPGEAVCLISAGELAVPVTTSSPGLGGRNQHFALHCALKIADSPHPIAVLSGGSDGIDGNSPAAGAVVDQTTDRRARSLGLDLATSLQTFSSHSLLQLLGDTMVTGPTGNNLRDLRVLLRTP